MPKALRSDKQKAPSRDTECIKDVEMDRREPPPQRTRGLGERREKMFEFYYSASLESAILLKADEIAVS